MCGAHHQRWKAIAAVASHLLRSILRFVVTMSTPKELIAAWS
jgi:hypothetical protein